LPRVEIVVVAHEPDHGFDELIRSVEAQTYPRFDLVVVASSPAEMAARLAALDVEAEVLDSRDARGFAAAANRVLDRKRAPLYLFCHDDVALAPDALRLLVEEALRSNAGIVGPKIVDWDRPTVLRQVGLGVDKLAQPVSAVEPGELDQEQHDAVRDVFAVPSACLLIRGDLLEALKGFDAAMTLVGEDVDLCWRAHSLGARVLVAPPAVVRHQETLDVRRPVGELHRLARRHQLRTVLSGYGLVHALRVVPQAAIATVLEALVALVTGRVAAARSALGAWGWNLRRLPSLLAKRRAIRRVRQLPDGELRELQTSGFSLVRTVFTGAASSTTGLRSTARRLLQGPSRVGAATWIGVLFVLVFGSRGLISGGIPQIGDLIGLGHGPRGEFVRFLDSWQGTGLGHDGASPFARILVGIGGVVTLGQTGLLRTLLILGALPLGGLGMWRLLAPLGTTWSQAVGLVTYLAVPVGYDAIAHGSLAGVVAFGLSPWLLWGLSRGAVPTSAIERPLTLDIAGLGVLLALGAAASPSIVAVAGLLAAGVIVGSALAPAPVRTVRVLATLAGGVAVATVLHLPWVLDAVRSPDPAAALLGSREAVGSGRGLDELLRLSTGDFGFSWLGWPLVAAALAGLVLGSGPRWAWAVRGVVLYVAGVAVAWVIERGWAPFALPRPEVALAVGATGLAVAVAMSAASIQLDLRRYRFGWRQLVPFTAAAALVLGALPVLGEAVRGRWDVPSRDHVSSVDRRDDAGSRVLWVGHDDVVGGTTTPFRDGTGIAVTDGFTLELGHQRAVPPSGIELVAAALNRAVDGDTSRLGRLLGPLGIRYVVVVERLASWPDETLIAPADPETARSIAAQLDLLTRVDRPGLVVYENVAWIPVAASVPADALAGSSIGAALATAPVEFEALTAGGSTAPRFDGQVPAGHVVWLAAPAASQWEVKATTPVVTELGLGWAQRYVLDGGGELTLRHTTSWRHRLVMIGQLALWTVALLALAVGRDRWYESLHREEVSR
jgi:GT2 family glycosyltransferase